MPALENPVLLAVIGAAHGIRGELRVKTFTGDPLAIADYGPLQARDGRRFVIEDIRPAGTVVVVRLKGVADRSAAEALNGTELFVERSSLPPEEEGEFYHADLIGLGVRDAAGETIGRITAVQNFGGGDILEIEHRGRRGVMIPFTEAAVPEVHVAGGHVVVDPVAAGLLDDEDEVGPDKGGAGEGGPDGGGTGIDARPRGPKEAGGNR